MHRLISFGPLLVLAIASGCNNTLDHDSAVKVTNSALTATAAAETRVMTTNASPEGAAVDVTLTNPAGGSAHVVGTVTKLGDSVSTKIDITFDHWKDLENNVTLEGSLHEDGTFSSPLPLSGKVRVTGALTASGAVSGVADFDIDGSYSTSGFSVTGHVGGQSIDVTLNISH
jgi:hypothetical protein